MYVLANKSSIFRKSDGAYIPVDDGNCDYIEFLKWVSEGNSPETPEYTATESRNAIEHLRLRAYSDPLTGSDRHFNEAIRMQAMGESGWEAVRQRGIARFEEIQQQYPWPA
ncbi:hypothetical protein SAMN05880558_11331 [Aeromonas sp. RU39B]|uniref:hypothetical protein n=1 Tax=Aeromonas sp. RU39B TaxID=1907416 RepID=UPI000955AD2E|nr:hypothetical protein [Aeromonas sp. RU39B]SIR40165.1 hypothetical protein SAMN05880558_11331 [Aeromonas sp. RU39B]